MSGTDSDGKPATDSDGKPAAFEEPDSLGSDRRLDPLFGGDLHQVGKTLPDSSTCQVEKGASCEDY